MQGIEYWSVFLKEKINTWFNVIRIERFLLINLKTFFATLKVSPTFRHDNWPFDLLWGPWTGSQEEAPQSELVSAQASRLASSESLGCGSSSYRRSLFRNESYIYRGGETWPLSFGSFVWQCGHLDRCHGWRESGCKGARRSRADKSGEARSQSWTGRCRETTVHGLFLIAWICSS